jgi:hypothetical protein
MRYPSSENQYFLVLLVEPRFLRFVKIICFDHDSYADASVSNYCVLLAASAGFDGLSSRRN